MSTTTHRDPLSNYGYTLRDPSLFESQGLIAGYWKSAALGKTFEVFEPSSGDVLGKCSDIGRQDFVDAIDSAYNGHQNFSEGTAAKEKGAILRRWNDLILESQDGLAVILSLENGKTLVEAEGEVAYAALFVYWFAEEAMRSYGDVIPSSYANTTVLTFKEPVSVCRIITPWNFPAAMIARKIAPALAAGCEVVIKPPSETPYSAIALAKLAIKAGIPSDCIHVVPTKDHGASMELSAAGTMKKVSMELGGNALFIVFSDANLDLAIDGAMISKFRFSGQKCVCTNRFLVHSNVVKEFTKKLVDKVHDLELGKGLNAGITQGPLVNAAAVSKVASYVEDALKKGGRLECGGNKLKDYKGYFYESTVISNATTDMEVARNETFGTLAAIFSFETEEEAI